MAAGSGASAPLANQWAARTLPTIWGSEPDSWFSTRQWPASEQATALRSRQKLIEVRGFRFECAGRCAPDLSVWRHMTKTLILADDTRSGAGIAVEKRPEHVHKMCRVCKVCHCFCQRSSDSARRNVWHTPRLARASHMLQLLLEIRRSSGPCNFPILLRLKSRVQIRLA